MLKSFGEREASKSFFPTAKLNLFTSQLMYLVLALRACITAHDMFDKTYPRVRECRNPQECDIGRGFHLFFVRKILIGHLNNRKQMCSPKKNHFRKYKHFSERRSIVLKFFSPGKRSISIRNSITISMCAVRAASQTSFCFLKTFVSYTNTTWISDLKKIPAKCLFTFFFPLYTT